MQNKPALITLKPDRAHDLEKQELTQLSFFRDEAMASLDRIGFDTRLEYREMDLVPVREVNELATLQMQTETLQESVFRLKHMMSEISYLLKK